MRFRWVASVLMAMGVAAIGCSDGSDAGSGAGGVPGAGGNGGDGGRGEAPLYSIGSIVTEPTGRTLFVQTASSLEGSLGVDNAIEVPGNSRHWAYDGAVFVGRGQEPVLDRYVPNDQGALELDRQLSFQRYGVNAIPAGFAFISPDKAYLILNEALTVVIFDPTNMRILDEIDISSLEPMGLSLETWMTTLHDGRLYVPIRRVDYVAFTIDLTVSVAIFDTVEDRLVAVASDDRCVGASRPAVGPDGAVYVLGDGRNYLVQNAAPDMGTDPPPTCMLRIPAGASSFDPEYFVDIADITSGRDAATAMWQVSGRPDVAFAKMYYPEELPEDADVAGARLWGFPVFKLWKLELGDVVTATETSNQPFSLVDFGGVPVDEDLYFGVTDEFGETAVYRVDPDTNAATQAFEVTGALREIHRLR